MRYAIIVGSGKLGSYIANLLSKDGNNVVVIDNNAETFEKLDENFSGFTIEGDGRELEILEKAKMSKADAVLCVTTDDNTNLMIAEIAKEIYKVKKVIARIGEPESGQIAQKLGIETICPTILSAEKFQEFMKTGS